MALICFLNGSKSFSGTRDMTKLKLFEEICLWQAFLVQKSYVENISESYISLILFEVAPTMVLAFQHELGYGDSGLLEDRYIYPYMDFWMLAVGVVATILVIDQTIHQVVSTALPTLNWIWNNRLKWILPIKITLTLSPQAIVTFLRPLPGPRTPRQILLACLLQSDVLQFTVLQYIVLQFIVVQFTVVQLATVYCTIRHSVAQTVV